jgi:hypothetical protein
MLRITGIIMFVLFLIAPAEARQRHVAPICDNIDVMHPCAYQPGFLTGVKSIRVTMHRQRRASVTHRVAHQAMAHHVRHRAAVHLPRSRPSGVSLAGVVPRLASKVTEIIGTCGSRVISAVRHTFVAGTHRISQHANGTAVDVAGHPSCIYSMLHGWPGGYSIDYGRVGHVHISIGGREAGARFVHGGGHRHHYAHHVHRHRYASR